MIPFHYEEMRREIMIGVEQSDRGDIVPFDAEFIKAEGRRILCCPEPQVRPYAILTRQA